MLIRRPVTGGAAMVTGRAFRAAQPFAGSSLGSNLFFVLSAWLGQVLRVAEEA